MQTKNHSTNKVYIGLGSNLGNPVGNVNAAIDRLSEIAKLLAKSSLYLSKPWGFIDQPDFINAVVEIETADSPRELLEKLKSIETNMGKENPPVRWGPRLIDLDILTFADLCITEADLTIPHPFMLERAFVLAPLSEIDRSFEEAYLDLPEVVRSEVNQLRKDYKNYYDK